LKSHEQILKQIDTISGIGKRAAEEIIVEAGHDKVSRFPNAHHLASWAKICPGNNESAGK
jgi:transposase